MNDRLSQKFKWKSWLACLQINEILDINDEIPNIN